MSVLCGEGGREREREREGEGGREGERENYHSDHTCIIAVFLGFGHLELICY